MLSAIPIIRITKIAEVHMKFIIMESTYDMHVRFVSKEGERKKRNSVNSANYSTEIIKFMNFSTVAFTISHLRTHYAHGKEKQKLSFRSSLLRLFINSVNFATSSLIGNRISVLGQNQIPLKFLILEWNCSTSGVFDNRGSTVSSKIKIT